MRKLASPTAQSHVRWDELIARAEARIQQGAGPVAKLRALVRWLEARRDGPPPAPRGARRATRRHPSRLRLA